MQIGKLSIHISDMFIVRILEIFCFLNRKKFSITYVFSYFNKVLIPPVWISTNTLIQFALLECKMLLLAYFELFVCFAFMKGLMGVWTERTTIWDLVLDAHLKHVVAIKSKAVKFQLITVKTRAHIQSTVVARWLSFRIRNVVGSQLGPEPYWFSCVVVSSVSFPMQHLLIMLSRDTIF